MAMQALLFHLGIAPRQAAVDTAMQEPAGAKLQMPILNVGLPQSGSAPAAKRWGAATSAMSLRKISLPVR